MPGGTNRDGFIRRAEATNAPRPARQPASVALRWLPAFAGIAIGMFTAQPRSRPRRRRARVRARAAIRRAASVQDAGAAAGRSCPATQIVTAMQAFRTGQRPATVMDRIAKGFSDAEIAAIAAWYAGQKQ